MRLNVAQVIAATLITGGLVSQIEMDRCEAPFLGQSKPDRLALTIVAP